MLFWQRNVAASRIDSASTLAAYKESVPSLRSPEAGTDTLFTSTAVTISGHYFARKQPHEEALQI